MMALLQPLLSWAGNGFGIEKVALPAVIGVGGGGSRDLVQRAAASMALRLAAALLSLLSSVVLARFLGAKGFGAYSYALTLVGLVAVPLTLGLPQLLVREVAAYGAREQWGEMGGLLRRANQVAFGGSVVLVLAALAVSSQFVERIDANGYAAFTVGLIMLPLMALAAMRMAALQGLGYVVLRQLPEGVCKPLFMLVLIVSASVVMGDGKLTPVRAMTMHLVAASLAFLLGAWFLRTRLPSHVRNVDPQYEHGIWLRGALPLLLLGGVQFANQQVGLLMLGSWKGPEAAGLYQVATRVAECIPLVLMAANAVLAPLVSQLYARGEMTRLQQLLTAASKAVLWCSAPIALAFILGGWWLLPTIFGADFAGAATALSVLSVGQLVNAGMGSVGVVLTMTGHAGDTVKGMGVGALLHIGLNCVLIPRWGLEGAALASAISLMTWNFLLAYWVYRRLGLYTTALGRVHFGREA